LSCVIVIECFLDNALVADAGLCDAVDFFSDLNESISTNRRILLDEKTDWMAKHDFLLEVLLLTYSLETTVDDVHCILKLALFQGEQSSITALVLALRDCHQDGAILAQPLLNQYLFEACNVLVRLYAIPRVDQVVKHLSLHQLMMYNLISGRLGQQFFQKNKLFFTNKIKELKKTPEFLLGFHVFS